MSPMVACSARRELSKKPTESTKCDRFSIDFILIISVTNMTSLIMLLLCVYTEDFNHLRRLATFAWLPRFLTDATRPLEMARDGFFYTGRRRVRCFWCGVEVPLDVHGLSPQQQHDALSPNCLPAGQLHGHPLSEELLRDVLFWMPMGVEIRRPGVSHQDLNINLR